MATTKRKNTDEGDHAEKKQRTVDGYYNSELGAVMCLHVLCMRARAD